MHGTGRSESGVRERARRHEGGECRALQDPWLEEWVVAVFDGQTEYSRRSLDAAYMGEGFRGRLAKWNSDQSVVGALDSSDMSHPVCVQICIEMFVNGRVHVNSKGTGFISAPV